MKIIGSVLWTLSALLLIAACSPKTEDAPLPEIPTQPGAGEEENQDDPMEYETLLLTVNGRSFTATLENNVSVTALKKLLMERPLQIRMEDYGDMEKVGALGFSLPQNDVQTTTGVGDIVLYQGNSIVIFYGRNTWSYTRLGKVDGVSTREEMLDRLGGKGSVVLTLAIE